jgi:hypothetical protein
MTDHLDPALQMARAQVLDDLSRLDGRGDPTHPMQGTFTGLGQPFTRLMTLEAKVLDLEIAVAALSDRLAALEQHDSDPVE